MNQFIIDTTVFVEYFRQNSVARVFLEKNSPAFSTVSKAELIQGARNKKELKIIIRFCQGLAELSIDERITSTAIELMEKYCLSHNLLFLDALIAATAIEEKSILVTDNVKHFSFVPKLVIKNWKEIEG